MQNRTLSPRRRIPFARLALLALPALWSCGGDPGSGPETPTAITILSGDGQSANAGTAVTEPLRVRVTGQSGAGVGGVTVSFSVSQGGGSVQSSTAVTADDGTASPGQWTLGDPGPQQLRASVSGLDPVFFRATSLDYPSNLVLHSGDGQTAAAGTAVTDPVQVRVEGTTGEGFAGVAVSFEVTAGGGSVQSATATTGTDGLASPGTWTLGAPGPQRLRATVADLGSVEFAATALGVPAALAVVAGADQEAAAGTAVPVAPEVLVTDSAGSPVPGVPVTFETGGGAAVTGAEAVTDTLGRAAVGSWTLGTTVGQYQLTASVDGAGIEGNPALIEARAVPGPAADVVIVEGDNQVTEAKLPVPVSPKIQARDAYGNGIGGLAVSFRGGGGSVAVPSQAETDTGGYAAVSRWILGPTAGLTYLLTAEVTDGDRTVGTVRFTATATPSVYDLVIVHTDSSALSTRQFEGFAKAEELLERAVMGNLGWSTVMKVDLEWCLDQAEIDYEVPGDRIVDDLLIYADVREVDGPGGIFAGAGPCQIRREGALPVVGVMFFDIEDLDEMEQVEEGRHLDGTIVHEMAHVMGFGSLWEYLGLLEDPVDPNNPTGNEDPHFVGDSAIQAFLEIGGDEYTGGEPVPAQNLGGQGVVNGHWREYVFEAELMTPFIDGGVPNPLSIVTLASLQDLGYNEVDLSVADEFELPSSSPEVAGDHVHRWIVDGDILRIPLAVADRDGRVIRYVMPGRR